MIGLLLLVIGVALGCLIRGVIKPKSNSSKEVETKKDSEELGTSQALIVLPMATSIEPSPSSDQVKVALQAERLRIKNALHDDTIQQLTAIKLKIGIYSQRAKAIRRPFARRNGYRRFGANDQSNPVFYRRFG